MQESAEYTLGLDLGSNSIGWALIETRFERVTDDDGRLRVNPLEYLGFLDTGRAGHPPIGVRVFEAGLDNFGTIKEKSLNQARRLARSMRRNHARRSARKRALREVLTDAGFLPTDPEAFQRVMDLNPYLQRTRALDQPVEPFELGRAIYHLGQRRGFKSNRKADKQKKQEDAKLIDEIKRLQADVEGSGARTLGEFLYQIGWPSGRESDLLLGRLRLRNRHTHRSMYEAELQAILDAQVRHHPPLAAVAASIRHIITYQHPFEVTEERRRRAPGRANLHRAPQVRRCPLEPDEPSCPMSDWLAQRFRILKEVNNIRVREPGANEWRPLREGERDTILNVLSEQKEAKFESLRKKLVPTGAHPEIFFNLERGKRDRLKGNAVDAGIAAAVGKKEWRGMDEELRRSLRMLVYEESDEATARRGLQDLGLDADVVDKLLALDSGVEGGYLRFSRKALEKILPGLESGLGEYHAVLAAYPGLSEAREWEKLPSLVNPDLPDAFRDLTNPVVRRALVEVRKVVNAIIREHGRPTQIVVELAREMKSGPRGRAEYSSLIREREEERRRAAERVRELGGNPDSDQDILRYILWIEQGEECVYTGRTISQRDLFGGAVDIDHILPRWESLDDSQVNKVLCFRSANQEKGQRTPAAWLGVDSPKYEDLLLRVMAICETQDAGRQKRRFEATAKRKLSILERARDIAGFAGPWPARLRRILQEHVQAEGFARRQLNDTQYLTRLTVRYLELLYPTDLRRGEKAVRSTRGQLTAELRRHWGLLGRDLFSPVVTATGEAIPEPPEAVEDRKIRVDHRHHAVDAVVVAMSSRASLKKYQDFIRYQESVGKDRWKSSRMEEGTFLAPWESLRKELQAHLDAVNVSHRPIRKVRGAFHEETYYGVAAESGDSGTYVTRKPLEALSGKDVEAVRDPVVQGIIMRRLSSAGWDGASTKLPKDWTKEPVTMPSGIRIRRVRVGLNKSPGKMIRLGKDRHRAAVLGRNHHLVLYAYIDGDGRSALRVAVVPRIRAAERVRREGGSPVDRSDTDGRRFVMSLTRKESVLAAVAGGEGRILCVVQDLSGDAVPSTRLDVNLRDARDSRPAKEAKGSTFVRATSIPALTALDLRKVQVDPLGRITPCND